MIRHNSSNSGRSLNNRKWSITTISAVFVIEFLLHSALSGYGVFFNGLIENYNYKFHDALWTPVVYIASWNIITPWGTKISEHFEENGHVALQCISIATILCMVSAIVLSSILQTQLLQIILYGIIGGTGTGIILSQIKSITYEEFQSKPAIFEVLRQLAKSFALFIVPHCILYTISSYDVYRGQFIFASLLLHIVPARLLVHRRSKVEAVVKLSRYKTIPGYLWGGDSIELPTINKPLQNSTKSKTMSNLSENGDANPLTTTDDAGDNSSSDSSESYTMEEINDEPQPEEKPQAVRFKTDMGVEILPEIPEEDEPDEDHRNSRKLGLDIKRLSKMSDKFEEAIDKMNRSENSGMLTNLTELERSIERRQSSYSYIFFSDLRSKSLTGALCCSPYQKYLFRRRWRCVVDSIYDNLLKPLNTSLKTYYFYPALFAKTLMNLIYVVYVTIVPHIALVSGVDHKVDVIEATFLLTFISVSWFFFIISLPWLINVSKSTLKIIYVFGLIITGGSFILPYIFLNHDMITLSCLTFGFGYGITSYAEEVVHREWLGIRKWQQVSGTLDTLAGTFVICSYLVIFKLRLDVITLFLIFCIFASTNAFLWVVTPAIKFVWIYFKRSRNRTLFNS